MGMAEAQRPRSPSRHQILESLHSPPTNGLHGNQPHPLLRRRDPRGRLTRIPEPARQTFLGSDPWRRRDGHLHWWKDPESNYGKHGGNRSIDDIAIRAQTHQLAAALFESDETIGEITKTVISELPELRSEAEPSRAQRQAKGSLQQVAAYPRASAQHRRSVAERLVSATAGSLKSYVSGKPWMRAAQRCQSSALGRVNEAAPSRCHKAGSDGRRRVGWPHPPINRHVGGAVLVALRPLRKRKVIGLVLEEPIDASQILLTEFWLPQHVVSRRQR